ncbi:hypothetical protein RhiirC2_724673 [Rhizophagus irregularis]|uniref:Uncharacterized protein n=1 Tax=Rhizophagus irregularis TaxID=588596 RepID=A0A2N1P2H7_9GLOM|nr:hypothetical protein RhiirC2_724673 [Rhizophagus irregularis]
MISNIFLLMALALYTHWFVLSGGQMRLMYEFLPDHFGIMLREQPQNRIGLLFAIKVALKQY